MEKIGRPMGVSILASVAVALGIACTASGGFLSLPLECPSGTECHFEMVPPSRPFIVLGLLVAWKGYNTWHGKGWKSSVVWTILAVVYFALAILEDLDTGLFAYLLFPIPPSLLSLLIALAGLTVSLLIFWYWYRSHVRLYFSQARKAVEASRESETPRR